jgi:hypothetical protein
VRDHNCGRERAKRSFKYQPGIYDKATQHHLGVPSPDSSPCTASLKAL